MEFNTFIGLVIDGGIAGARADYNDGQHHYQLLGSVDGFEACRGKSIPELMVLLHVAGERATQAHREQAEDYWYHRCYQAEIEWVCNCVSALLYNQGLQTIVTPTMRGYMRAAEIVGLDEPSPGEVSG